MLSLKTKMQDFLSMEIKINCILTVGKKNKNSQLQSIHLPMKVRCMAPMVVYSTRCLTPI